MTYCPSQGWDDEVARQDAAALGQAMTELSSLAEKCYVALLANPQQNTTRMAVEDLARFAYESAAAIIEARSQIEGGGNGYINVAHRKDYKPETWEEVFWCRWGEVLLP